MFYYKQEMNYEAPKWMEGVYTLKVRGRKITIERLSHDDDVPTKSHATCHKDDQFDIGEGAKVALDRLNKKKEEADASIKIGDTVKIVDAGRTYSTFKNFNDISTAARYRYGVIPLNYMTCKVVGWYDDNKTMAIVEEDMGKKLGNPEYDLKCYNGIYVIGVDGLKKV